MSDLSPAARGLAAFLEGLTGSDQFYEQLAAIQRDAEDKLIERIVRLNYGKDPDLAKRMDEAWMLAGREGNRENL